MISEYFKNRKRRKAGFIPITELTVGQMGKVAFTDRDHSFYRYVEEHLIGEYVKLVPGRFPKISETDLVHVAKSWKEFFVPSISAIWVVPLRPGMRKKEQG